MFLDNIKIFNIFYQKNKLIFLKPRNNYTGFTLIETIVYLTLFSLVIGGVVVSAYYMFESSNRNQTQAMVAEEGSYLLGKIDWAFMGAISANVKSNNKQLLINHSGAMKSNDPFTFDGSGNALNFSRGAAKQERLNNTNTQVINLSFISNPESSNSSTAKSIDIAFTLSALTADGLPYSQSFQTTEYFKK